MNKQIEKIVREYAIDFESKAVIANELVALAQVLKSEAVKEMEVIESKILSTRQFLGDVVVEVKEEVKPVIVTPEEIAEEKVYEAKSFSFENVLEEKENSKIQGSFTYNRKKYYYQASNNMLKPMVYGAKDTAILDACMKAIEENVDKKFYDERFKSFCPNVNHQDRYYYDMDREIVIYYAPDGSFKGYFQGKTFVWDPEAFKVPTYASYKNSLDTSKYRPLKNEGQAQLIISLCNDLQAKASYLNADVIEEKKQTKKEEIVTNTQEERVLCWDKDIEGNPDDWNEDIDWDSFE